MNTTGQTLIIVQSLSVDATVTGTITGWRSPTEEVRLPGAQVRVEPNLLSQCPDGEAPLGLWSTSDSTAEFAGDYSFTGAALNDTVIARLTGDWVEVFDCDGTNCVAPRRDVECQSISTDPDVIDLSFNLGLTEFSRAQVTAFLDVQGTHEWFKFLQPALTAVDIPIPTFVNSSIRCNARFKSESQRLEFSSSGVVGSLTCINFAVPTIISHEYAHFLHHTVFDFFGQNSVDAFEIGAFAEGIADTISSLKNDDFCMGLNQFSSGACVRDLASTTVQLHEPGDVGIHEQGEALGGAFWDLRSLLTSCEGAPELGCATQSGFFDCEFGPCQGGFCSSGPSIPCVSSADCTLGPCSSDVIIEELATDLMLISDGRLDESVMIELLVADDTDGDLATNGTTHCSDILCAFVGGGQTCNPAPGCDVTSCTLEGHGWACPDFGVTGDGSVFVDWEGPIVDPTGSDFDVLYELDPPGIVLKATQKGGFAVDVWFVSRFFNGVCSGGANDGAKCNGPEDCPSGVCTPTSFCVSGDNDGAVCTGAQDCASPGTCEAVLPLDLGTVFAQWNLDQEQAFDIEVRACARPGEPCRNLNIIDIATESAGLAVPTEANYSSVGLALQTTGVMPGGALLGRARSFAANVCDGGSNDGSFCTDDFDCPGGTCALHSKGGRVGGSIAGDAKRIWAASIGSGASTPGTLDVGGDLAFANFGTVAPAPNPGDPALDLASLSTSLIIDGGLDGDIKIQGDQHGLITVNGSNSSGSILVNGDILGFSNPLGDPVGIQINGDMSGDIIADADNDGNGTIIGRVIVTGEFTGDICGGSDISIDQPLPARIDITLGPGASICGVPIVASQVTTPPSPDDIPTNRYLTFEGIAGEEVAIQIELVENTLFPGSTGVLGWLDFPDPFPLQGPELLRISRIRTNPFYDSWDFLGIQTFHVSDCEIAPGATYALRAIRKFMDTSNPEMFSEDFVVSTIDLPLPNEWGDIVGIFDGQQWTAPDGTTNIMDAQAAIQAFRNHPNAPALVRADVVLSESSSATVVVDMTDIQSIILAFQGRAYPYPDPVCCTDPSACGGGGPMGPGGSGPMGPGGSSLFSLVATPDLINANDTVDVDVFIDMATDLGASQVTLEVTGGDTGSLTIDDLIIDATRQDYAFNAVSSYEIVDLIGGRLGAVTSDGSGVTVSQVSYLGTFRYRASMDASGVFNVNVMAEPDSFLNDSNVLPITISLGTGALVGVGVACTIDAHCDDSNNCTDDTCINGTCSNVNNDANTCTDGNDCTDDVCISGTCVSTNDDTNTCSDGNDCTDDACVSGVCTSTNEPANTPCDDGLFCTKTDKCDGAGTCVGSGSPCLPRAPVCCELTDTCVKVGVSCEAT